MARERLSMKFDSKTAGKTGQLLFLQKACSAIGGSPFRRPAPPPVSKESPPFQFYLWSRFLPGTCVVPFGQ